LLKDFDFAVRNYKLTIEYDGTDFSGWQIQKNAVTVQQTIKEKLETIFNEEINLIGSGRTDAGVHALGQVANFRIDKDIDKRKLQFSLNGMLPRSISISNVEEVDENFHSRFDAKKRSYFYFISSVKSPFYGRYSWLNTQASSFDLKKLNELSSAFLGKHDFTSFARAKTETENKYCEIYSIHWRRRNFLTIFYVEADRFLHGMVRTLVGTILNENNLNGDKNNLLEIIRERDRTKAGEAVKAKGLFLYKVRY
jgi:tRNA pseudouridine38-40 synthase